MANKFVALFLAFAFLSTILAQSYYFEVGNKNPGDRQLHYQTVTAPALLLQVVEKDAVFPAKDEVNDATISYIGAQDWSIAAKGANISIPIGGIDQLEAKIHFRSPRGYGLNFTVEIWGQ